MGEFKKYDVIDQDITFIKEQIEGPKQNGEQTAGRKKEEKHIARLRENSVRIFGFNTLFPISNVYLTEILFDTMYSMES